MKKTFALALTLLVAVAGCAGKKTAGPTKARIPLVAVSSAVRGEASEEFEMTGHLEAVDQADISSKLSRMVERVLVREGDSVVVGQPLIVLDSRDFEAQVQQAASQVEAAQANTRRAQVTTPLTEAEVSIGVRRAEEAVRQARSSGEQVRLDLEDGQRDVKRKRELFADDAIPRTELERAELRYAQAQKNWNSTQAQLRSSQEALLLARANLARPQLNRAEVVSAQAQVGTAQATQDAATVQLDYTVLRSPVRGVVVERKVEPGQSVGAQTGTLLRIVDPSKLELVGMVPERYLSFLKRGAEVTVLADSFPDQKFSASLHQIVPEADQETHSLKVRLRLQGANSLVPGLYARAQLKLRSFQGVTVPATALQRSTRGSYVLLLEGDKVRRSPVTVSYEDESKAILTSGVKEGAEVVVAGGEGLPDGQVVERQEARS